MAPKFSICIPTHNMKNRDFFLERALNSVRSQTFQDYEIITTDKGKMAENTNAALKEATGEYLKILYMDDFLAHPKALQVIWDEIQKKDFIVTWIATGCNHDSDWHTHLPEWSGNPRENEENMKTGKNTIGSPSVITMKREYAMMFDENLSWLLDCDLYLRLSQRKMRKGLLVDPLLINDINVTIGVHNGQMTNLMSDDYKLSEHQYVKQKYA